MQSFQGTCLNRRNQRNCWIVKFSRTRTIQQTSAIEYYYFFFGKFALGSTWCWNVLMPSSQHYVVVLDGFYEKHSNGCGFLRHWTFRFAFGFCVFVGFLWWHERKTMTEYTILTFVRATDCSQKHGFSVHFLFFDPTSLI